MIKYVKSSLKNYLIMAFILLIFTASLFIPYMMESGSSSREGMKNSDNNLVIDEHTQVYLENIIDEIDEYSRFYLDAIMDDIELNDPKMNSAFSIELLRSVGSGDSYIENTLSDMDLIIPEKIKRIKARLAFPVNPKPDVSK